MGYKILGFVVWRGALWYVRRRYPNAKRTLIIVGGASAGAALAAGTAVAVSRSRSESG